MYSTDFFFVLLVLRSLGPQNMFSFCLLTDKIRYVGTYNNFTREMIYRLELVWKCSDFNGALPKYVINLTILNQNCSVCMHILGR